MNYDNSKIVDYKGKIIDKINELKILNEKLKIYFNFDEEFNDINEMLDKVEPSLMFYGVYNAGKSTLLNAIFGTKKASVADVPETHKVTSYRWQNFDLVDTPGINGPESDLKISQKELEKHDVIMFVISDSDDFDSSLIANEIVEIIYNKKPLIIVLNKKQDSDKEAVDSIRNKISKNIIKAANNKNIDAVIDKYEFIDIDAKTAFKGKEEGKKLLKEVSRINDLEIMINEALKNVSGIKILINPVKSILDKIDLFKRSIKKLIEEKEGEQIVDHISEISEKRIDSLTMIESQISSNIRRYKDLIYNSVISGREDFQNLQDELSKKVSNIINELCTNFVNECNVDINLIFEEVKLNMDLKSKNIQYEPVKEINNIEILESTEEESNFEKLIDIIVNVPIPAPIPSPVPIPIPPGTILKYIYKLFKGNGQKKYNIEAMQKQIDENNRIQAENFNKRLNAIQEIRSEINIKLHNFEEEVINIAKKEINDVYNQIKKQIDNILSSNKVEIEEFNRCIDVIANIENELNSIKLQLMD